jgi:hypothetical protein
MLLLLLLVVGAPKRDKVAGWAGWEDSGAMTVGAGAAAVSGAANEL